MSVVRPDNTLSWLVKLGATRKGRGGLLTPRGRHVARYINVDQTPLLGSGTRGSRRGKNYPRGIVNSPNFFYPLGVFERAELGPTRRDFWERQLFGILRIKIQEKCIGTFFPKKRALRLCGVRRGTACRPPRR